MKGTSPTRSGCWPARHRSAKIEFRIFNLITRGEVMQKITTVGIDLAKSVFSLHGVDGAGRVGLRRTVRRDQLLRVVAGLSQCLIGMEACSGAHEWGRRFQELGHTVRLMAPKFVAPYRKSGKNDGNDAEAICEAGDAPEHAFCAGEVGRAAGALGDAPGQAGVRRGEDRDHQPAAGAARRVWGSAAASVSDGTPPGGSGCGEPARSRTSRDRRSAGATALTR